MVNELKMKHLFALELNGCLFYNHDVRCIANKEVKI